VVRELVGVADTWPTDGWCWATQAAEVLVQMQKLVDQAVIAGQEAVDPAALAEQIHRYRSAAQISLTATAARSSKLMKSHNALARRHHVETMLQEIPTAPLPERKVEVSRQSNGGLRGRWTPYGGRCGRRCRRPSAGTWSWPTSPKAAAEAAEVRRQRPVGAAGR